MSGVKTKTIPIGTYTSLVNNANKVATAEKRAAAEKHAREQVEKDLAIAKSYNKDLERRINNLGDALKAQNKEASEIKKELISTVKNTNAALERQAKEFDDKIQTLGNDFADIMSKNNRRIEQVINQSANELKKDMNDLRESTQRDINSLKANVKSLAERVGDPRALIDAGQDYLDIALELINQLKDSRHEKFFPGRMQEVINAANKANKYIDGAKANPANAGNAILLGENAFEAAHKLYQDIAEAETLWKSKLSLALEALAAAEAEIEARASIVLEGTNGNEVEHDTDFWSKGALAELKAQVKKLRDVLLDANKAKNLSFEDLDGIADLAKDIFDDSEEVRKGAAFAILTSQERITLAAVLAKELSERVGLTTIKASDYEGKDMRAANLIHLKNETTGFEIVITLKPTIDENGRCGYAAVTEIIDEGDNTDDADSFETALKEVMKGFGLAGDDSIPVNPEKTDEIKDWSEKKAKSVATVTTNPAITEGVKKISGTN